VSADRPLAGRRVVTTRDEPGRLDSLLARAGADVVHVPLIEIADPPGSRTALEQAVTSLCDGDWVVVTSHHGARRVGALVGTRPGLRLAAVGRSTAATLASLAGRMPDVVPARQTGADLAAAVPPPFDDRERVLVAQADRAEPTLVAGLAARGHRVIEVVAYSTRTRRPSAAERRAASTADAVTFASGSAAESWAAAFGAAAPDVVVAIGPTTAAAARAAGLKVTSVAVDHSVDGLAAEVALALAQRS
jgi:uroporphyrinogen-III synthase